MKPLKTLLTAILCFYITGNAFGQTKKGSGTAVNGLSATGDVLVDSAQKLNLAIDVMGGRRHSIWGYFDYAAQREAASDFLGSEKTLALHLRLADLPVSFGVVLMKTAYDMGDITDQQIDALIIKSMASDGDSRPPSLYTGESHSACDGWEFGPEMKIWSRWLIYQPYLRTALLWSQYHIDNNAQANTTSALRVANATDFHEMEDLTGLGIRLAPGIAFCPLRELQVLVEYAFSMTFVQKRHTSMSYQHRTNSDSLEELDLGGPAIARHNIPTHTFSTGISIAF